MKHTYSISDAAKILQTESHVLRYWEEELELSIPRNEHGHRYYRDIDLDTFKNIMEYKENGYSLQDIKKELGTYKSINKKGTLPTESFKSTLTLSSSKETKLEQFRQIMDSIIVQAISQNNEQLTKSISEKTSERVIKEINYLFRTFDEDEETRHKQIEAAITAALSTKKEIAATKEKRRFFSLKK